MSITLKKRNIHISDYDEYIRLAEEAHYGQEFCILELMECIKEYLPESIMNLRDWEALGVGKEYMEKKREIFGRTYYKYE